MLLALVHHCFTGYANPPHSAKIFVEMVGLMFASAIAAVGLMAIFQWVLEGSGRSS